MYYITQAGQCPEKVPASPKKSARACSYGEPSILRGKTGRKKRSGIRSDAARLEESAVLSHLGKALTAVHRTIGLGLKGDAGFPATGSAGGSEELSGGTGCVLASVTAGLATLGLVLEASLSVEFLLTGGKNELVAALFAN